MRIYLYVCCIYNSSLSIPRMVLLNYLAATDCRSRLRAALVLSTPWNVFVSSASLEQPVNYLLFNRPLTSTIRNTVQKYRDIIGKVLDVDYVLQSGSIREFDERYTSVVFGYKSCDDYYHHASPDNKLRNIRTPVLCINAADDPFSPLQGIPLDEASANPHVALLILAHGGHIGFLEGLFPNHQSYIDRVFKQFSGAAFCHWEDLRQLQKINFQPKAEKP
ncbi:phospholipase ABHD3-like [Pseudophryne corroboree]|uniref:phospholipase ABHD3-like n=1 Tax=Pseudophryne corroboree TaxID=495146 RepID=UPI003081A9BF